MKYLWKNKTLLIILIFAFWLVPQAISIPEQSRTETIVTGVAIDKVENDYEVTLQYIVPHASTSSQSLNLSSDKGKTIDEAISKVNAKLGKFSGFAHCRVLVFNEKACEENFTKLLDSFLRKKTNTNNIILINTKDSAKDLLGASDNLDSNLYSYLNNNAHSDELKNQGDLKSIGDYYVSYLGPSKTLAVNVVDIEKESGGDSPSGSGDNSGGGGSNSSSNSSQGDNGGSGGSQSNSSQSSEEKKQIKNEGKLLIIKNQKKLLTLSAEDSKNLNLFNQNVKKSNLQIKDFSDENLVNADITFDIYDKSVKTKVYFRNNEPYCDIYLKIHLRTSEVFSNSLDKTDYEVLQQKYTDKLFDEIRREIINRMQSAERNFKDNNYDVINCEEAFYKFKNGEYKKYLKLNNNKEEFIKYVHFNYYVDIAKGA